MTLSLLLLGGARSGKSRLALRLAQRHPLPRLFIATATVVDEEMAERISRHREERGERFETLELEGSLSCCLKEMKGYSVVVVDCLTLYLARLLEEGNEVEREIEELCTVVQHFSSPLILVSNEVGLGIVPASPLARRFRDLLGFLHQELVQAVQGVALVVAGIPLWLKGGERFQGWFGEGPG